jgi:protein-disulfide isomerase-like protein with CxxC motif
MRHVLLDLAQDVGLDMDRFTEDFDSGSTKRQVLHETRTGWEELKVEGSPTFVLPSGQQFSFLALPKVKLDRHQNYRAAALEPASCSRDNCLDTYRQLFEQAINEAKRLEVPQFAINGA